MGALTYLLKPATEDRLFPVPDQFFRSLQKPEEGPAVKFKNVVANLLFASIAYVEVFCKTLLFHMTDRSVREIDRLLYPNIQLDDAEVYKNHGKYGSLRLDYLHEQKPQRYRELLFTGKSAQHCADLEQTAFELAKHTQFFAEVANIIFDGDVYVVFTFVRPYLAKQLSTVQHLAS